VHSSADKGTKEVTGAGSKAHRVGAMAMTQHMDVAIKEGAAADTPYKTMPQPPSAWESLAPMLSMRSAVNVCVWNDRIYAVGGHNGTKAQDSAEAYDIRKRAWSKLPDMISPRYYHGVCVWEGKIFAIGGHTGVCGTNTCEYLDIATNSWHRMPPMATARYYLDTAVLDGKIYAIGGYNTLHGASSALQTVEVYDIAAATWTMAAPLSIPRKFHSVCAMGGSVYVFGGQSRDKDNLQSSEVFRPETGVWEPFVDMDTIRVEFGICVHPQENCIFIAGAFQPSSAFSHGTRKFLDSVERYNMSTRRWTRLPAMTIARSDQGFCFHNNKLYIIGGFDGTTVLDTVEVLDYAKLQYHWKPHLHHLEPTGMKFCVWTALLCNNRFCLGDSLWLPNDIILHIMKFVDSLAWA